MSSGTIYGWQHSSNFPTSTPSYTLPSFGNSKSSNPLTSNGQMVPAIIGAVAALAAAGTSAWSSANANKKNQQNFENSMAFNADQAAKQMNWQKDMWNAANEYNSPYNQRQRLEAAGINPYMAMGNISTGTATSTPSGASASAPSAPQINPVGIDTDNFLQGISMFQMLRRQGIENDILEQDLRTKKRENRIGDYNEDNDKLVRDMEANMASIEYQIRSLEKGQVEAINRVFDKKVLAELVLLEAQGANEKQKKSLIYEQTRGLRIDNDQLESFYNGVDKFLQPLSELLTALGKYFGLQDGFLPSLANMLSQMIIAKIKGI